MAAILPFKTAPKPFELIPVGDDEMGVLEIPKYQDLSPNERIYIRDQMADYPDLRVTAAKMAKAIAEKSGKKIGEIYNALVGGDEASLDDYLEDFVDFQGLIERVSQRRRVVLATAILRYRLVPEWTLESTGDANLIHPKLVGAIADFGRKEEMGWQSAEETESAPEPASDEEVGKSSPPQETQETLAVPVTTPVVETPTAEEAPTVEAPAVAPDSAPIPVAVG